MFTHAKSLQSCPILCNRRLQPARLLCSWDSPGKFTGVSCHTVLNLTAVRVFYVMKMSNMDRPSESPQMSSLTTNSNETSGGHSGTHQPGDWKLGYWSPRCPAMTWEWQSQGGPGVELPGRPAPLHRWAFYLFHISRLHLTIYFVEMSFLLKIIAMEICSCDIIF